VGRSHDHTTRARRRLLAVALAFSALGLLLAAGALALGGPAAGSAAHLDEQAQLTRVLPPRGDASLPGSIRDEVGQLINLKRPATRPHVARNRGRVSERWRIWKHMPAPVKISIPAIGVSAPIIPLDVNADHTLKVPTGFSVTGWFKGAAEPGEAGPAVVVGHVDSVGGPGVFYHLRALRKNDVIKIAAKDGSIIHYTVSSTMAAPKNKFPTKTVYGRTPKPTIRLITCDGAFNSSTGHYVDNFIVFAQWAGTHRPR
jgi:hypothetical protein